MMTEAQVRQAATLLTYLETLRSMVVKIGAADSDKGCLKVSVRHQFPTPGAGYVECYVGLGAITGMLDREIESTERSLEGIGVRA